MINIKSEIQVLNLVVHTVTTAPYRVKTVIIIFDNELILIHYRKNLKGHFM